MTRVVVALIVGSVFVAMACERVGSSSAPVIYGPDDRLEVHEVPAGVHRDAAGSSVVMQTDADFLDRSDPSNIRFTYDGTLGGTEELCADVRFFDQPDPGYCSGTLIDDRHVMTAGHCVETADDCSARYPWVFGYYYESAGVLRTITENDVYECVDRVVFRNDLEGDYAIIELDRPVVGHEPAILRSGTAPAPNGTALTLIGHPNGIPMKVAGDATVLDYDGQELFTDLDAFFGNSGSGVWDDAGVVVGILVAGSPADYRRRPGGGGCFELVELTTGDDYEYVQPVHVPVGLFCDGSVSSPVCGDDPPPADGGMPGSDAGAPAGDGGTISTDAGSVTTDMGTDPGDGMGDDDGCSCATEGSRSSAGLVALVLFGLVRRRRLSAT